MAKSASPRFTMAIMTVSPAVAWTSVLRPPFSFSTLAMAELLVWLIVPGCIEAKPKVWASAATLAKASAATSDAGGKQMSCGWHGCSSVVWLIVAF